MDTVTVIACPIMTCYEAGEHQHVVCPRCGCIGATNPLCEWCVEHIEENYPPFVEFFKMLQDGWREIERAIDG